MCIFVAIIAMQKKRERERMMTKQLCSSLLIRGWPFVDPLPRWSTVFNAFETLTIQTFSGIANGVMSTLVGHCKYFQ